MGSVAVWVVSVVVWVVSVAGIAVLTAVDTVGSVGQLIGAAERAYKTQAVVFSAFSSAAFLIAAASVYGMILLTMNRRRKEFGIRLALGSPPQRLLKGVIGSRRAGGRRSAF